MDDSGAGEASVAAGAVTTGGGMFLSQSDHRVRSSSGISGFGDLGRDYGDGFQRGVLPRREIDHMRHHVTMRMTSEDYTSQM